MKQNIMNLAFFRNKTNILAAAALLSVTTISAQTFSDFNYRGNDKIYNDNPLKPDEFYSPILQGCYPDPSITRKGEDYYLVNSSFSMFPGVPIFTSKDLVNWKQVGHVLDRPSQLKVEKSGVSHGIYARTSNTISTTILLYDHYPVCRWYWKYGRKNQRSGKRMERSSETQF